MHPLLRVDDIYGGVYSPGDGTIDPTSICNAYAKAAKKYGGGVYENVSVTWDVKQKLTNTMNVGIFEDDATSSLKMNKHEMVRKSDSDVNGWRVGDSCFD